MAWSSIATLKGDGEILQFAQNQSLAGKVNNTGTTIFSPYTTPTARTLIGFYNNLSHCPNLLTWTVGTSKTYNLKSGGWLKYKRVSALDYEITCSLTSGTPSIGVYQTVVGLNAGVFPMIVIDNENQKAAFLFTGYSAPANPDDAYCGIYFDGTLLNYSSQIYNLIKDNQFFPDPYLDGGTSTSTFIGTGTFDDTSESVPLPTTYALSATASGIMSQYVLSEANLSAFGSWLWNGGTIVDDLKHFFQSPMEAIFSVGILPFTPSDTTQYNVYVGALAATGVQGGHVDDTVEKISCGSITFDGYYGGALDYNPYTKIELFLPYCGTLTLNADEVMGHTIGVDYYCDTITGDCVAFVSDEDRVLHQVRGNCFVQIPLAARDFTALYSSAIAAIGTIAAGLATAASGGISAPVAVGMGTSMAANAMNAKTHIARAGGVSGMAGFMSIQTPYVIMTIPNQCLPEFQREYQGYPLFVTKRLGDFSGFTKVYEIHLDGLDCTDAEAKEIYELLKGGVIL